MAQVDNIPVDTDKEIWIEDYGGLFFQDVIEKVKDKWPEVSLNDINIRAVKHHQYAIYYDLYDSSDYVNYIVCSID